MIAYSRKCSPINGEVWTDKGAYTFGEHVRVKWTLHHEDSKLDHVRVHLIKLLEYRHEKTLLEKLATFFRISDPGHPMLLEKHNSIVASKQVKANGQSGECTLEVPHKIPITMAMTLWNVITVNYEVLIQVKVANQKEYVELRYPVIVCSEGVQVS